MRIDEYESYRKSVGSDADSRAGFKIPFVDLAVGGKVRIRFLQEYNDGLMLFVHDGVVRSNGKRAIAVCWKNKEIRDGASLDHCIYCDQGLRRTKRLYWLVWDYANRDYRLLSGKDTSYSFVPTLREFWLSNGTILDRDWTILRSPDNSRPNASTYIAIPDAPSELKIPREAQDSQLSPEDIVASLISYELKVVRNVLGGEYDA